MEPGLELPNQLTSSYSLSDDFAIQQNESYENLNLERLKALLKEPSQVLQEKHQLFPLLSQLKILSRKQQARVLMGHEEIGSLVNHLKNCRTFTQIAAEGANVILNVCYEKENVLKVLECGGAALLIEFLNYSNEELQANAAGALQSICFQPEGRKFVRNLGAIPFLVKLLDSNSGNVKARAVGTLHNISSDVESIKVIRRRGGIGSLVKLLQSNHPSVCGSAAGALQNVSREVASRTLIRESQALHMLVGLLSNSDVQAQVCAAGALLNVLGPEMNQTGQYCVTSTEKKRKAFTRCVTSMLLINLVIDSFFSP